MSKLSNFQTLRWAGLLFLFFFISGSAVFDCRPALADDAYMAELSQLGLAPASENERAVMGRPFDALVVDPVQLAEAGLGGLHNGDMVKVTRVGPGWWRLSWSGSSIWTSVEEAAAPAGEAASAQRRRRSPDSTVTKPKSLARATRPTPEPHSPPLTIAPSKTKPRKSVSTASARTAAPTTTAATAATTTTAAPPVDRPGPPTTMGKIVVSSTAIARPTDRDRAGIKEENLMTGGVEGRVGRPSSAGRPENADEVKTEVVRDKGKRKIITLVEPPEEQKPKPSEKASPAPAQADRAAAPPPEAEPTAPVKPEGTSDDQTPEPVKSTDRTTAEEDRSGKDEVIHLVDPVETRAEDDLPTGWAAARAELPDPAPIPTTTTLPERTTAQPAPTTAAPPPTPPSVPPTAAVTTPARPAEAQAAEQPVPPFPVNKVSPAAERSSGQGGETGRPGSAPSPHHKSSAKIQSPVAVKTAPLGGSVSNSHERPTSKTYWINRIRAFKSKGSLVIQVRVSHRAKAVFYRFKNKDGETWLVVDFPNTKRKLYIQGLVKVRSSVIRRIRSADHERSVRLSAAVRSGVKFRASAKWRGNLFELRIRPRN